MHVQTHIMSGWCLGNLMPLTARERLFCMLAASLPDLDGFGWFISDRVYSDYHHVLGHNLAFAIGLSLVLAAFSPQRVASSMAYVALVHLHFIMDLLGSGLEWGIPYWWPVSTREWMNPNGWELFSWQNITAAAALLACTLGIAGGLGRTPLEALMPSLDRQLVALLRRQPLPPKEGGRGFPVVALKPDAAAPDQAKVRD